MSNINKRGMLVFLTSNQSHEVTLPNVQLSPPLAESEPVASSRLHLDLTEEKKALLKKK